mmetsp:Transcript_23351/g.40710  ORF Transcript_23351/g.40710 Transcript_23351/m.40710 type:complete len:321 (+) Transcript_23351:1364-2326(+)
MRSVLVLVMALCASAAIADTVDTALRDGFSRWLADHNATGRIATRALDPDAGWRGPSGEAGHVELASLSKSITAVCALTLVEAGKLQWSDRLPDLLGAAPDVTVAQLITHSSGLTTDSTQVLMSTWLDEATATSHHRSAEILSAVNARGMPEGPVGAFHYNNENYAVLGLVIEAATGMEYADYCFDALDLSDTVRPSARSGAFLPWGGMEAQPQAFVGFLTTHFGPDGIAGRDPFAWPHIDIGGGAYYGLGMIFRRFGDSHNFWHFGALCFPDVLNIGSYAVIWEDKAAALAAYDGCRDWDAMFALDGALARAVYQVADQ